MLVEDQEKTEAKGGERKEKEKKEGEKELSKFSTGEMRANNAISR